MHGTEKNKLTFIYALLDPRTDCVRYIGKTTQDPDARLYQHMWRSNLHAKRHCSRWLSGLGAEGLKPTLQILERVPPGEDWAGAEQGWIAGLRHLGVDLVNIANGGEGVAGWRMSPEHRAAVSKRQKGRQFDAEWRRKISEARRGKKLGPPSPEAEARRKATFTATIAKRTEAKTHCKNGHALVGDNLVVVNRTQQMCRTCQRIQQRLGYERRRGPLKERPPARVKVANPKGYTKTTFKSGEGHRGAKLSWAQVDDMRARVAAHESRRSVAERFNVALTTVDQIIQGKCWKRERTLDGSPHYLDRV